MFVSSRYGQFTIAEILARLDRGVYRVEGQGCEFKFHELLQLALSQINAQIALD